MRMNSTVNVSLRSATGTSGMAMARGGLSSTRPHLRSNGVAQTLASASCFAAAGELCIGACR